MSMATSSSRFPLKCLTAAATVLHRLACSFLTVRQLLFIKATQGGSVHECLVHRVTLAVAHSYSCFDGGASRHLDTSSRAAASVSGGWPSQALRSSGSAWGTGAEGPRRQRGRRKAARTPLAKTTGSNVHNMNS